MNVEKETRFHENPRPEEIGITTHAVWRFYARVVNWRLKEEDITPATYELLVEPVKNLLAKARIVKRRKRSLFYQCQDKSLVGDDLINFVVGKNDDKNKEFYQVITIYTTSSKPFTTNKESNS